MFFEATVSIDPSQVTELRRVAPSKAFGRLFHVLTGGRTGEREEVETFTALSILQQLNVAMRGLGITDIVRLARDGRDFYLDTAGRDDDLEAALESFSHAPSTDDAPFVGLKLVLEHDDDVLHYLVEIDVTRAHRVGTDPITVGVSALLSGMEADDRAGVDAALAPVFADQSTYDAFVTAKRQHFDAFVVRLSAAVQATIAADRLSTDVRTMIVRAREPATDVSRLVTRRLVHGEEDEGWGRFFHGYHGIDRAFLYAYAWTELAHARAIALRGFTLVDDTGRRLCDVGRGGLPATEGALLLPGATAPVRGEHVAPSDAPKTTVGAGAGEASSSWLGGMFEGGAATHEGSSSGGDDSGCGSCSGTG